MIMSDVVAHDIQSGNTNQCQLFNNMLLISILINITLHKDNNHISLLFSMSIIVSYLSEILSRSFIKHTFSILNTHTRIKGIHEASHF